MPLCASIYFGIWENPAPDLLSIHGPILTSSPNRLCHLTPIPFFLRIIISNSCQLPDRSRRKAPSPKAFSKSARSLLTTLVSVLCYFFHLSPRPETRRDAFATPARVASVFPTIEHLSQPDAPNPHPPPAHPICLEHPIIVESNRLAISFLRFLASRSVPSSSCNPYFHLLPSNALQSTAALMSVLSLRSCSSQSLLTPQHLSHILLLQLFHVLEIATVTHQS